MDIISILKEDYQKFPLDQTYSVYAKDVYFEDPMNKFRGCDRYQKMINFIKNWFVDIKLDLHEINQSANIIKTRWTLSWTTPMPWLRGMRGTSQYPSHLTILSETLRACRVLVIEVIVT